VWPLKLSIWLRQLKRRMDEEEKGGWMKKYG
jgi:hypothetical protein